MLSTAPQSNVPHVMFSSSEFHHPVVRSKIFFFHWKTMAVSFFNHISQYEAILCGGSH